ncbi:hypothetical protein [Dyadobacter sp. 22481]|uniref:hypothetical protein n=1 Tax=Dyadobacter sp. 22481 TaxID=3453926 RepID=UPI003F87B3C7
MDQIIQVINAMIENQSKISNVEPYHKSYFFVYNGKYIFSIVPKMSPPDEAFWLNVFPSPKYTVQDIMRNFDKEDDAENIPQVTYDSDDFKSPEATETFRELMQVVKSKLYNLDAVFSDILTNGRSADDEV